MTLKSPYKAGGMFEGASHLIFANAKHLRKNMTDAEIFLWMYLKNGIEGLKFRRQHPIGVYIADFYCHKVKLIIEADGSIHNRIEIIEKDQQKEKDWGYNIIRFTNKQILSNTDFVIDKIKEKINLIINFQKTKPSQKAESETPL